MRLILDPAEDAAHGDWLRSMPGAYEWWYFDALSDDGQWALTNIWFLGNPFSPYYRLAALGQSPDPYVHNAVFFALYRAGRLHAYHFTRFPRALVCADEDRPAVLRFGPNELSSAPGEYRLALQDENANRRRMEARLSFRAVPLKTELSYDDARQDDHCWLPAAPSCRVEGAIRLREAANAGAERLRFTGHGYHDHNWGTLPFSSQIQDWYWARLSVGPEAALVLYLVNDRRRSGPIAHLLWFEGGRLTWNRTEVEAVLRRRRCNGFGTVAAAEIQVESEGLRAAVRLGRRLDSAPFYIRFLSEAKGTYRGETFAGTGVAEYFRPRMLAAPLAASATKARIVEA